MPRVHREVYIRGGHDRPSSTAFEDVQDVLTWIAAAEPLASGLNEHVSRRRCRPDYQPECRELRRLLDDVETRPRGVIREVGEVVQKQRVDVLVVRERVEGEHAVTAVLLRRQGWEVGPGVYAILEVLEEQGLARRDDCKRR